MPKPILQDRLWRNYAFDEIATRQRSWDYLGYDSLIWDPDPVMNKAGFSTLDWIDQLRFLLTDAHVGAVFETRREATLSHEWEIEESDLPGSRRAGRKARDLIEEALDRLDVRQIISDVLWAPYFGMAPLEVVWTDDGRWIPDAVTGKPPEWFGFDQDGKLRFLSVRNSWQGEELPAKKILLPRHNATYRNPYGERLLSSCYWPITFKRGGLKFWAIFVEKYGMPWVTGKVPRGTSEADRAAILSALQTMVQDAAAVINDDESIEFQNQGSGRSASSDLYQELCRFADEQISKAILGQTLTTESGQEGSGSYALGQVHAAVLNSRVQSDQALVRETMDTLFAWIVELNMPGSPVPRFRFYEEENLQKDRAERDQVLKNQGLKFTRDYYLRTYGFEEDDLKEEQVFRPGALPLPETGRPAQRQQQLDDAQEDDQPGEFIEKKKISTRSRRP